MLNKKDYWIVEFNEGSSDIKDYRGLEVTEELIDEIKILDEEVRANRFSIDLPARKGYYKFYFDHYVDGEAVEHTRIDIGDGVKSNEYMYDILIMRLVESRINNGEITVDENKVVNEENFINAVIDLKLSLYKFDKSIEVNYTNRPIIRLVVKNVDEKYRDEVAVLVDNFKYQNYLLNIWKIYLTYIPYTV